MSRKILNKKINEGDQYYQILKIYCEATIIKYFGTRSILDANKLNRIHIKSNKKIQLTLKVFFQLVREKGIIQKMILRQLISYLKKNLYFFYIPFTRKHPNISKKKKSKKMKLKNM